MRGEKISGENQADFETKKTKYFSALALELKKAFKMQKAFDLLAKNDQGVKDWRNASEHMLVVAARTRALSRLLGISETTSDELFLAAGVHDFYKRKTVEKTPKGASMSMQQQIEAENESTQELEKARFPQNIISYTQSIGSSPDAVNAIQTILKNGVNISERELAALVMHYVDDFTMDSNWATPAGADEHGKNINDLNRRIQAARNNPKYKGVDEEGRKYFGGKSGLDNQESVGELVEQFLETRLAKTTGKSIVPKSLPTLIDDEIKKEIEEYTN